MLRKLGPEITVMSIIKKKTQYYGIDPKGSDALIFNALSDICWSHGSVMKAIRNDDRYSMDIVTNQYPVVTVRFTRIHPGRNLKTFFCLRFDLGYRPNPYVRELFGYSGIVDENTHAWGGSRCIGIESVEHLQSIEKEMITGLFGEIEVTA